MPKANRKPIGRKFKGSSNSQAPIPSVGPEHHPYQGNHFTDEDQSNEVSVGTLSVTNFEEIDLSDMGGIAPYEDMNVKWIVVAVNLRLMDANQPGPSGLQRNLVADQSTLDPLIRPFQLRLASLKIDEKQTAKAFNERNMVEDYEWQVENKCEEDALIRKQRNAAKLHSARNRQFRSPDDDVLRPKRY